MLSAKLLISKKKKLNHVTFITLLDFYYIIRFKNQHPTLKVARYLQDPKERGKRGEEIVEASTGFAHKPFLNPVPH